MGAKSCVLKRAVMCLFASLAVSLAAHAQIGLWLDSGAYWPFRADLHLRRDSGRTDLWLHNVGFRGRSLDSPFYYGLRVSRPARIAGHSVESELEFVHAKAYANETEVVEVSGQWDGQSVLGRKPFRQYIQSFSLSHGLNFLFGNLFCPVLERGGFRAGLRLGVGISIPHVESQVEGRWVQRYQASGLCYQAGVGGSTALRGSFRVDFALRWTLARLRGMKVHRGSLGADMWGFHFNLGLGYSLARARGARQVAR
jgi:hypothetical protein